LHLFQNPGKSLLLKLPPQGIPDKDYSFFFEEEEMIFLEKGLGLRNPHHQRNDMLGHISIFPDVFFFPPSHHK
jgi:hypothetical protein